MKKMFIGLCVASLLVAQAPAQSFSARLNAQHSNQPNSIDKFGKLIVGCACEDLFPAVQEVMLQNKSELKDLVKLQLKSLALSKDHLHAINDMVRDATPLLLEGAHVCAQVIKKHSSVHSKRAITMYQRLVTQMMNGEDEAVRKDLLNNQKEIETIFGDIATDEQLNHYVEKVQLFNEKWAESFAAIMQAAEASAVDNASVVQSTQLSVQKIAGKALGNARAMRVQSLVMPLVPMVKTKADVIRVIQACLVELETKLPDFAIASEKFAQFAAPYLVEVITESIDEINKSMPA
jgi:hypothetical protein